MKNKEYSVWIVGSDWIHEYGDFNTLKEAVEVARDIARVGCAWLELASLYKSEIDEISVQVWDDEGLRYNRKLKKSVKEYILRWNRYLRG
jgi:hypothetical protein